MLLLLLLLLRGSSTSSVFPALFRSRRPSIAPSQSRSWWQEIFPQVPSFCCLCASGRETPADLFFSFFFFFFWQENSRRPRSLLRSRTLSSSAFLLRCRCSQTSYVLSHSPRRPFLSDPLPLFFFFPFSFSLSRCRFFFSFSFSFSVLLLVTFFRFLLFTHLLVVASPSLSVFPSSVSSSSFLSSCDSSSSSSCSSPHY